MEAIGRLAGGIAHDFNNFLTVMRGHSQLALMDLKEGDPFKESFEAIENATMKSANLVRQILAFSRRQVMEMIVLDLNSLLRGLEKMLRRIIGEDIELLTVLADDLGRVKADPGQIEQGVVNLAVNARDAMLQGGKLTIETANVELDEAYARSHVAVTPGRYVMIAVSDTGVGMTPEIKERVFEPFFTTKEKGKGTGLGLSTVYGIVKQSGGNIWIYSEPGPGATFKIYLPRVEELLTEEKEKEESGLFRGVGVILVVEDEEMVRKVVLEVLRKQGYSVLEAADEEDALLICQQYKDTIHLMVTDVVMPKISGPELAKRLVAFHPEMKVLYMSGYADNAIVHHGVLDKGVNYIQKPFTFDGLARKVREVLEKDPKPAI
jgi:CheY-like chemotaxis protein